MEYLLANLGIFVIVSLVLILAAVVFKHLKDGE